MILLRRFARLACVLACAGLFAGPAMAQQYKCVDANGRVTYADKGGPGCTGKAPAQGAATAKPPPPVAKGAPGPSTPPRALLDAAKAPGTPAKAAQTPAQPPETKQQLASRCTTTQQEYDWLRSKRGEGVAGRDARLAQMQKALAACP